MTREEAADRLDALAEALRKTGEAKLLTLGDLEDAAIQIRTGDVRGFLGLADLLDAEVLRAPEIQSAQRILTKAVISATLRAVAAGAA